MRILYCPYLSPILQNGKLIGAVTHVLISDPTAGYGILLKICRLW
jgi:hypothetical protein